MNIDAIRNIYFLGIGGIGMSALARYFVHKGARVYGYDRTATPITRALEELGIGIHYQENPELIPANIDLAVFTPAIQADSLELKEIKRREIPVVKRAQLLAELTRGQFTIAVAGTHGKTTITSLIAHLLHTAGIPVTAFIGGIANNFNSNIVLNDNSKVMIVEADEFDQSFLQLSPDIAVVSSMDADHLDIYRDHSTMNNAYQQFVDRIKANGVLIKHQGLELVSENKSMYYGLLPGADIRAGNIHVTEGKFGFEIRTSVGENCGVRWLMPGRHNISNAIAAVAVGLQMQIPLERLCAGLDSYLGVKRRFEFRINRPDCVFIDDYAHHPEELRACIGAARELYPGKTITGIFQPHLFSRTRDFIDGFAQSLALLDELLLLEIYPARELPISGVNSAELLRRIPMQRKRLIGRSEIVEQVVRLKPEVLLTLGAGDIDQLVEPIAIALNS